MNSEPLEPCHYEKLAEWIDEGRVLEHRFFPLEDWTDKRPGYWVQILDVGTGERYRIVLARRAGSAPETKRFYTLPSVLNFVRRFFPDKGHADLPVRGGGGAKSG